jgi:DNA polymerase-1
VIAPEVITIDFETEGIEARPKYPPIPVGFSILEPGKEARYYAWGHPCENNCTFEEAQAVLLEAWNGDIPLLFHNAKFDVDVAQTHMSCGPISWERVHDTLFLLFLHDPHASTLSLKPAAAHILGMAPDEQEAVRDWLMANSHTLPSGAKLTPKTWGAWICKAPGKLVGTYAEGDVIRTKLLFDRLYEEIDDRGMTLAYDRERELLPFLMENERQGVRVDIKELRRDLKLYEEASAKCDAYIRERLGVEELNIDSDPELARALKASGVVTQFQQTPKGRDSVSKANLTPDMFNDEQVSQALGYRNRLATCLSTFIRPWLAVAEINHGYIFTNWNQVRQMGSGKDSKGARTGRMSSNPNFQNIPKSFSDKDDGYSHPTFLGVPELPNMRRYILPDPGEVLLHRDYNQQELRILAHFEDASLCAAYNADPTLDVHTFVQTEIQRICGLSLERRAVKILNFGMIYGMGLGKLAVGIHATVEEARTVKNAQRKAIPGLAALEKLVKQIGSAGEAISTWGGRIYYVEDPMLIAGRLVHFEYKLLNYLIQGSAADVTKQALINYAKTKKHGRFLITVHDEINISCPAEHAEEEMAILKEAMASVKMDVPLLSDGKMGKNWGALEPFKEPVCSVK